MPPTSRAGGLSAGLDLLKSHARVMHRSAQSNQAAALARLRIHPELHSLSDGCIAAQVKRRHCLAVAASEMGFDNWPQAAQLLRGEVTADRGRLLCPEKCMVFTNIWSASYTDARALRVQTAGYLLVYRRQYLVVDRHYIAALGIDPDAAAWRSMNRDWLEPGRGSERCELYAQAIAGAIRDFLQRGPQFKPSVRRVSI